MVRLGAISAPNVHRLFIASGKGGRLGRSSVTTLEGSRILFGNAKCEG